MIEWFHHLADNPAEAPVVASWFVSSVALVTAFVTVVTATIAARTTSKVASRNTYINSVTAERSKWIDALRRSIADFSGAAERIYARRQDSKYQASAEWANDVQSLRTHFSSLKMRLNPREQASINFLTAARALDQAARIHRWADLELANEIMVRHGQWILKYEWHRVKMEAASGAERRALRRAEADLHRDYDSFLQTDGTLDRLKLIGAGVKEIEVTLARSAMDVE